MNKLIRYNLEHLNTIREAMKEEIFTSPTTIPLLMLS